MYGANALLSDMLLSASLASDLHILALFSPPEAKSIEDSKLTDSEYIAKLCPFPPLVEYFSRILSHIDANSKGKSKRKDTGVSEFITLLLGLSIPFLDTACSLLGRYP